MLTCSLAGLKVIDFTQIAAGPTCTMLLADLGAEVIKIEAPGGELGRSFVPCVGGESVTFMSLNRNKRSITLDLKDPEQRAIGKALMASADVVVESFRPGVMKRLKLGYEDLVETAPHLVYCSVSAYGQTGPWKDKPGVDGVIQAVSGLMSVTGSPGAPPCKVQVPVVDMVTGYLAAVAVLAALNRRRIDGQGQYIDLSMFGSAIALQQSTYAAYLADDVVPERIGSAAPYAAPNEALRCADGWIMVAAYHPARWLALCETLGAPELATDRRFADLGSRIANRAVLVKELEQRLISGTKSQWLERFERVDIICAPINDYAEAVNCPAYLQGGLTQHLRHPTAGDIRMPRSPFCVADASTSTDRAPPLLGEHTRQVLTGLGCTEDRIEQILERQRLTTSRET